MTGSTISSTSAAITSQPANIGPPEPRPSRPGPRSPAWPLGHKPSCDRPSCAMSRPEPIKLTVPGAELGGVKVGAERDGSGHGDLQTGDRHRESYLGPPGNPPHESTKLRLGINHALIKSGASLPGDKQGVGAMRQALVGRVLSRAQRISARHTKIPVVTIVAAGL